MLKNLAQLVLLCLLAATSQAQILHPVKWSYAAKKTSATEAVVFLKATLEDGWHLYSQTVKEGGPVRTTFTFDTSPAYTLAGATQEPKPITHFEKMFDMEISFYEKSVIFQQKVKLKKGAAVVKGTVNYMVCNDNQCLPPEDVAFAVAIK